VELLKPLDTLFSEWPLGFEGHVSARLAAGPEEARTLNGRLGPWYGVIKRAGLCQGLKPFLEVVMRVAAREFDGVLGLDMAAEAAVQATEHLRVEEAAKRIGAGREQLLAAVKAGLVSHRTRRFGTRGLVYELPVAEVASVQTRRAEWVDAGRAAELAGVSGSVLSNMLEAGVVGSDAQWRRDVFKGGLVELKSLSMLLNAVNEGSRTVECGLSDLLMWRELTSRRMGDKKSIQSAMRAAVDGQLKAVRQGQSLGEVAFLRVDVQRFFGTPLLEAGLSITQLAKATGWKWESISHWIDEGLLEADGLVLRGQPCRVVSPKQLLRFRQTYIPLADAAHAIGTTSTALADQLPSVAVQGAKTLPNGARRGGLVQVSELVRLAVFGAARSVARIGAGVDET